MAFKCPFQNGETCPTEKCSLYILTDPLKDKHECALVDAAYSLKNIAKDIAFIKEKNFPKK